MAQAERAVPTSESAGLKEWSGWLAVPGPVRRKKRVSKTIYWDECPACGERVTGWSTDTRVTPAYRLFKPCGCTVWEPGAAETRSTLNTEVSSTGAAMSTSEDGRSASREDRP